VPFSDPMAEGPVIQRACERALAMASASARVWLRGGIPQDQPDHAGGADGLCQSDRTHRPEAFIEQSKAAGADGAIVVDYPPEEAFAAAMRAAGLDLIFLLAPTSTEQRIAQVAKVGRLQLLRLAEGRDGRAISTPSTWPTACRRSASM
jgi:tryptophan synthase alpha chain